MERRVAGRLADALDAVLARWYSADGRNCDYAGLARSAEHAALREASAALDPLDPRTLAMPAPLAFWINAYNAAALLGVLEAGAPESVHRIADYFSAPRLRVGGHAYSLDDIEHGLLRGNAAPYGRLMAPLCSADPRLAFAPRLWDERVHFALHCASRSAPALRVFRAATLSAQLETAACTCVEAEVEARPSHGDLQLPMIFKWYQGDFGGRRGVIAFVVARLEDAAVVDYIESRGDSLRLAYRAYDWSLNSLPHEHA